jgi:hypothetical protein
LLATYRFRRGRSRRYRSMAEPTDPEPVNPRGYVRGTTIPYPDLRASSGPPPAWFVQACADHRARRSKAPGASDSSLGEGVDPVGDPTTEAPPQSLQLSSYGTTRSRSPKRVSSDFNTDLHRHDQAIPDNLVPAAPGLDKPGLPATFRGRPLNGDPNGPYGMGPGIVIRVEGVGGAPDVHQRPSASLSSSSENQIPIPIPGNMSNKEGRSGPRLK